MRLCGMCNTAAAPREIEGVLARGGRNCPGWRWRAAGEEGEGGPFLSPENTRNPATVPRALDGRDRPAYMMGSKTVGSPLRSNRWDRDERSGNALPRSRRESPMCLE